VRATSGPRVRRGDVWIVGFDPVVGHEQGGRLPVLVISTGLLHSIPSRLAIVVPISTRQRGMPSHVSIQPPEGGLVQPSFAMTEQPRAVSTDRLGRCLGTVEAATRGAVIRCIRWFLDL
jgi:mRNA interferase MazF